MPRLTSVSPSFSTLPPRLRCPQCCGVSRPCSPPPTRGAGPLNHRAPPPSGALTLPQVSLPSHGATLHTLEVCAVGGPGCLPSPSPALWSLRPSLISPKASCLPPHPNTASPKTTQGTTHGLRVQWEITLGFIYHFLGACHSINELILIDSLLFTD